MYATRQAILDLIAACGAQELYQITSECMEQATDDPSPEKVVEELQSLVACGELCTELNPPCEIFKEEWRAWGKEWDL